MLKTDLDLFLIKPRFTSAQRFSADMVLSTLLGILALKPFICSMTNRQCHAATVGRDAQCPLALATQL